MGIFNIFRRFARSHNGRSNVKSLLEKAKQLEAGADTKEKVKAVIAAYESILAIDPGNRMALACLRSYCFLMAHRYDGDPNEKANYYVKSIEYSERLVASNKGLNTKIGTNVKNDKRTMS